MGFLTGFATGALQAANQQFSNDDQQYQQAMNKRAAAVDTVAENWNKYQDKAAAVTQKQNSYMAQFNIPSDAAYSLANDDSFEKMPKDQQQEYAQSLAPVPNKMTPATPGGPKQITPDQQTRGTLFTSGRTVPGVSTPDYPAQPARQIYQGNADPLRKVAITAVGNPANFANPDGTVDRDALQSATASIQAGDYKGALDAMGHRQQGGAGASGAKDPVFQQVQALVTQNLLDPADAPKYYTTLGGKNPQAATLFNMLGTKPDKADPVFAQKVAAQEQAILHNDPTVDPQVAHDRAVGIVSGAIKAQPDAVNGGGGVMDLTQPKDKQYTRFETTGLNRQRISEAQNVTFHAANTLTSLNRNIDLLAGNKGVVGYQGELANFLESHGVNLANAVGANGIATAISEAIGSNDTATYRAESRALMASMAKEIIGEPKTAEDQRKLLDGVLGDEWKGTPLQINAALHVLKERAIQNFANNLAPSEEKQRLPYLLKSGQDASIAPAGRESMPATDFRDYIVEKYHIPRNEANQAIRYITSFQPEPKSNSKTPATASNVQ